MEKQTSSVLRFQVIMFYRVCILQTPNVAISVHCLIQAFINIKSCDTLPPFIENPQSGTKLILQNISQLISSLRKYIFPLTKESDLCCSYQHLIRMIEVFLEFFFQGQRPIYILSIPAIDWHISNFLFLLATELVRIQLHYLSILWQTIYDIK